MMKKSTILSLIATSLCCSEGNALVDIALPAATSLHHASVLLSSQSPAIALASSFAESTIGSSSLALSDSFPLAPVTPAEAITSILNHALDISTFIKPNKMMMRLSTLGSDSFIIAENIPLITPNAASPLFEAEVLTDMAHVALDFSGLLSPSRSVMRLYSIIGRFFALGADYIPDHLIHPEELMIQFFLICVTLRDLIQEKLNPTTTPESPKQWLLV